MQQKVVVFGIFKLKQYFMLKYKLYSIYFSFFRATQILSQYSSALNYPFRFLSKYIQYMLLTYINKCLGLWILFLHTH